MMMVKNTMTMMAVVQLDSGGGVGVGVIVTVVCSTESLDADRLPMRSRVTASLSGSALLAVSAVAVPAAAVALIIPAAAPRFPVLDVAVTATTPADPSALLPAHCTAPPRPTVTDSHFCLPLFFFLRLKKQQHLEMKQTLIGLRVVPLWQRLSLSQHTEHAWTHVTIDRELREKAIQSSRDILYLIQYEHWLSRHTCHLSCNFLILLFNLNVLKFILIWNDEGEKKMERGMIGCMG